MKKRQSGARRVHKKARIAALLRRAHKKAGELAALVDQEARLERKIREGHRRLREVRAEFKEAGQIDLARKFLRAPIVLKDLAGVLWFNQPLVPFLESDDSDAKAKTISPADFPERFELERSEGKPIELHPADFHKEVAIPMLKMTLAKFKSNVAERLRGKSESDVIKEMLRQWAIDYAWMWPLEEWACIFPNAVLAGDFEFIDKIRDSYKEKRSIFSALGRDTHLALCWHNSVLLSTSGEKVPALKHWSDRAQCEYDRFARGDNKLNLITDEKQKKIGAYRKRKSRLGGHNEPPVLVRGARYTRDGNIHRLHCWR